jgi:hypothetical protein
MGPGEDGDPIFCDRPASIKWDGSWLCAEHYDEAVVEVVKQVKGSYIYRQGMLPDLSGDPDNVP